MSREFSDGPSGPRRSRPPVPPARWWRYACLVSWVCLLALAVLNATAVTAGWYCQ